jgi:hypothetical protein
MQSKDQGTPGRGCDEPVLADLELMNLININALDSSCLLSYVCQTWSGIAVPEDIEYFLYQYFEKVSYNKIVALFISNP